MAFLNKTYKFVSQENFDAFLKASGVPADKIEKTLSYTPDQKIVKDGDTYNYIVSGALGTKEVKFKSGVEFDDKLGTEQTPVKSTIVVDGNTVIQTAKGATGVATFKREYNGDDLVVTVTLDNWDGSAKRYYKAA
ncbi:fatty acid-binding protein 2-like [Spodoptera litura]|uniref:Fatty acid binding protein n=1 Tax=Spodoptera litura TaxID=69820 RepID=F8URE4_SPOLT|nr:fatty acid-binding protein 2-like [Spodoptera litura]AEH16743.1 fatty acid binding protein [Spodoptera litura]